MRGRRFWQHPRLVVAPSMTETSHVTKLFAPLAFVVVAVLATPPALAQDVVSIGFTASKTGALGEDSLAQVRGFELWRDEVNASGGIKAGAKRYKIEFKSHDDESQVVRVQELYGRLIAQDKAQFLLGPVSSGLNAMAALRVGRKRQGDAEHRRRSQGLPPRQSQPVSGDIAGLAHVRGGARGAQGARPADADRAAHQGRSVYPCGSPGDARPRQG